MAKMSTQDFALENFFKFFLVSNRSLIPSVGDSFEKKNLVSSLPNPLKGTPKGGGWGAKEGIKPKIMFYINSVVFKSGNPKLILIYILEYPQPPQGRPRLDTNFFFKRVTY